MSICAGLVGLPNVGKSTLFNALTKSSVPAENYPFCTIDPHTAITPVPDENLDKLAEIFHSKKKIPATVSFVDIAGLVKGAASGEGLGNQFLGHIRDVDLILHVVRCFEDPDITRQEGDIDPVTDYEIISTELMLKDLESVTKRIEKVNHLIKPAQNNPPLLKELMAEKKLLEQILEAIDKGDAQTVQKLYASSPVSTIPLLCAKPFLIIANISEHDIEHNAYAQTKPYQALIARFGAERVIPISAKIEGELSQLSPEEAEGMMSMMGLEQSGLARIITTTFKHLGLVNFYTCGPQEAHAWPIKAGTTVRNAAGEIHSDLERGFICADVYSCHDLFAGKTEAALRQTGKIRTEGQDYQVQDGDCIFVKFNV